MKPFRFPLEKALEWRRQQLEMEESRFKQKLGALAELDRSRAELEASAIRAELEIRTRSDISGQDLSALAAFRAHLQKKEHTLAVRRAECQHQADVQHQAMLEARRRCRLLERLRERRFAEWRTAAEREVEQLAADSHLAGIVRQRG